MDPATVQRTVFVKFSQLVRDEMLLKPRLDDDTLVRGVETVQSAYRDAVVGLHESVMAALDHIKEPFRDGELAGLYGEAGEDTFNVDNLAAELSGEPCVISSEPKTYPDVLIRTVDEEGLPDAHFIAFMESKPFHGKSGSVHEAQGGSSYLDVRRDLERVKGEMKKAREAGNDELAEELRDIFESLQVELRSGEPMAVGEHTGKKNAELAQDPPAAHYAKRHSES